MSKTRKRIYLCVFITSLIVVLCVGLAACSPTSGTSETGATTGGISNPIDNSVYESYVFTSFKQLYLDTAHLEDELGCNPHGPRPQPPASGHFDNISECQLCHITADDGRNEMWCTSCHIGMAIPEGWNIVPTVPFDR